MMMKRLGKLQEAEEKMIATELALQSEEEKLFHKFPPRDVSSTNFEEKPFGNADPSCQNNYQSADGAQDLPSIVVSFALFDGEKMLFACSGIPIPDGLSKLRLSRFVTSAHLVQEFNRHRNKDDNLRVIVRLPNGRCTDGFLGLFDGDIAIVTSLGYLGVEPVDLDLNAPAIAREGCIIAAGRAFNTGTLMTMNLAETGSNCTWISDSPNFSEAVLGGPLVQVENPSDGNGMIFVGMNLSRCPCDDANVRYSFLSKEVLHERLKLFRILEMASMKNVFLPYLSTSKTAGKNQLAAVGEPNWLTHPSEHLVAHAAAVRRGKANAHQNQAAPESARSFCKELHFREYSLPDGVSTIIPSGFVHIINRLKHFGYPTPPPLVLEFNGRLLNCFEGYFGSVRSWKGFPVADLPVDSEHVWERLSKKVVTNISRRVVSLISYKGNIRFFACTGLLIKWHAATLILTSANLVRGHDTLTIDDSLRIDVNFPPDQRADGKLELYNLSSNYALLSIDKNFRLARPEDIFNEKPTPKKVVAVGRDVANALLMGSMGEVMSGNSENTMLMGSMGEVMPGNSENIMFSTCKINKVGIGGPLINIGGSFVGMNFYNGSKLTPAVPKRVIVRALENVECFALPWRVPRREYSSMDFNGYENGPMEIDDNGNLVLERPNKSLEDIKRWNAPKPYWCHGELDVYRYHVPILIGRTLH